MSEFTLLQLSAVTQIISAVKPACLQAAAPCLSPLLGASAVAD